MSARRELLPSVVGGRVECLGFFLIIDRGIALLSDQAIIVLSILLIGFGRDYSTSRPE